MLATVVLALMDFVGSTELMVLWILIAPLICASAVLWVLVVGAMHIRARMRRARLYGPSLAEWSFVAGGLVLALRF